MKTQTKIGIYQLNVNEIDVDFILSYLAFYLQMKDKVNSKLFLILNLLIDEHSF